MVKFTAVVPETRVNPSRRPTEKGVPNVFGAAANLLGAYGQIKTAQAKANATATQAANDAAADAALDDLARSTFADLSRDAQEELAKIEKLNKARGQGRLRSDRYDVQLTASITSVMNRHRGQEFEIMNALDSIGVESHLFRGAKAQLAAHQAEQDALNTVAQNAIEAYKTFGEIKMIDGEQVLTRLPQNVSLEDMQAKGIEILQANTAMDLMKEKAAADKAALEAGLKKTEAGIRRASRDNLQVFLNHAETNVQPIVDQVAQLLASATETGDNALLNQSAPIINASLERYISQYTLQARQSGMTPEDISQLEAQYTQMSSSINEMLTGDLSVSKMRAQALSDLQTQNKLTIMEALPQLALLEAAFTPQGVAQFASAIHAGDMADIASDVMSVVKSPGSPEAIRGNKILAEAAEQLNTGIFRNVEGAREGLKLHGATVRGDVQRYNNGAQDDRSQTQMLNKLSALGSLANQEDFHTMEAGTAKGIIDTLGAKENQLALATAINSDFERGTIAARSAANGIQNAMHSITQKGMSNLILGSEYDKESGRYVLRDQRGERSKKDAKRAGNVRHGGGGGTQRAKREVALLNKGLDFLEWSAEYTDLPGNLGEGQNVRDFIAQNLTTPIFDDEATPAERAENVAFEDGVNQLRNNVVGLMAPQSPVGRFFGDLQSRVMQSEGSLDPNTGQVNWDLMYDNVQGDVDIKPSESTLQELVDWSRTPRKWAGSDEEMTYGQWVQQRRQQAGGGDGLDAPGTPFGAFGFVASTIEHVAQANDIPMSTVFSPTVQQMMFEAYAWERRDSLEEAWPGLAR